MNLLTVSFDHFILPAQYSFISWTYVVRQFTSWLKLKCKWWITLGFLPLFTNSWMSYSVRDAFIATSYEKNFLTQLCTKRLKYYFCAHCEPLLGSALISQSLLYQPISFKMKTFSAVDRFKKFRKGWLCWESKTSPTLPVQVSKLRSLNKKLYYFYCVWLLWVSEYINLNQSHQCCRSSHSNSMHDWVGATQDGRKTAEILQRTLLPKRACTTLWLWWRRLQSGKAAPGLICSQSWVEIERAI